MAVQAAVAGDLEGATALLGLRSGSQSGMQVRDAQRYDADLRKKKNAITKNQSLTVLISNCDSFGMSYCSA